MKMFYDSLIGSYIVTIKEDRARIIIRRDTCKRLCKVDEGNQIANG